MYVGGRPDYDIKTQEIISTILNKCSQRAGTLCMWKTQMQQPLDITHCVSDDEHSVSRLVAMSVILDTSERKLSKDEENPCKSKIVYLLWITMKHRTEN